MIHTPDSYKDHSEKRSPGSAIVKRSNGGCSVSFSSENSNGFLRLDATDKIKTKAKTKQNKTKQKDEENFRILFGLEIAPLTGRARKDFKGRMCS